MDLEKLLKKLEQKQAMRDERKTEVENPFEDYSEKESFVEVSNEECAEMMTVFAFGMHLCGFDKTNIEKPTTAFSMFLSLWSNKKAREKILEMKKEQVGIAKTLMDMAN